MKFFGIEIAKERRSQSDDRIRTGPTDDFWFNAVSALTNASGVVVTPETVLRVAIALSCVRVLSETIGTLPLKSYIKDGRTRREENETDIARLFSVGPNLFQTTTDYIEKLVAELILRGNHFSIIRGRKGIEIKSLESVEPSNFVKVETKLIKGRPFIIYSFRNPSTREIETYTHEEVLHIKGLQCNSGPLFGTSVISHASDAFGAAIAAERFSASTFKNQGMPAGILEYPEGLEEDEVKNIIESWQKIYGGADNAGKVAILEHGMKYQKIGLTPQDTQLLDTRKFSGTLICGMFRVPPHKVAMMEKATWGNIEHQNIEFSTDSIRPWTVKIEQAIKGKLYGYLDLDTTKYYSRFNTDALLRGDITTRYASYATGRQWGWLSANDILEKEDMNPIEAGDIYLTPMNMIPAETAYDKPEEPAKEEPVVEEEAPVEESKNKQGIIEIKKSFKELFTQAFTQLMRLEVSHASNFVRSSKGVLDENELETLYREKVGLRMAKILLPISETYSKQIGLFLRAEVPNKGAEKTMISFITQHCLQAMEELRTADSNSTKELFQEWNDEKAERQSALLMQELETTILKQG